MAGGAQAPPVQIHEGNLKYTCGLVCARAKEVRTRSFLTSGVSTAGPSRAQALPDGQNARPAIAAR